MGKNRIKQHETLGLEEDETLGLAGDETLGLEGDDERKGGERVMREVACVILECTISINFHLDMLHVRGSVSGVFHSIFPS